MSDSKKRPAPQQGPGIQSDGPERKVLKVEFSGIEVHEQYVKEKTPAKTAAFFIEKIFTRYEETDGLCFKLKEKSQVQRNLAKKIAKFELKLKGRHGRHDLNFMSRPFIQASDYCVFNTGEQQEGDKTEPEASKNEEKSGASEVLEEVEESDYEEQHVDMICINQNEECVKECDFLSESDEELDDSEDEDEGNNEEDQTWNLEDLSRELSVSVDSNNLLMSPQAPVRTSSKNEGTSIEPAASLTPIKKVGTPRGAYKKQLFTDKTKRTKQRRVNEIKDQVKKICQEQGGMKIYELCGLLLRNEYWETDREKAEIGQELLRGEIVFARPRKELDAVKALYLIERNKMTKAEYLRLRRIMKQDPNGALLPSYPKILSLKKRLGMGIVGTTFMNGIRADIRDVLRYTLSEILEVIKEQEQYIPSEISFSFNYGADGSGKHQQLLNEDDISTTEVFLGGVTISSLKDSNGTELWTAATKGHNSPYNFRPFLLIPHKESSQILDAVFPLLDLEINDVRNNGLNLTVRNHGEVKATLASAFCSLIDGKMIEALGGLGGSFCTMCTKSGKECEDIDTIRSGIKMDRTMENTIELAKSLWDPRANGGQGAIKKGRKDYKTRKGITDLPKTEADICRSIAVLHLKIKVVEWFKTFMIRLNTTRRWRSSWDPVKVVPGDEKKMKEELNRLGPKIRREIGVDIDKPDSLPTGPMFYKFSTDAARKSLVDCLIHYEKGYKLSESEDEEDKRVVKAFEKVHIQLCAIVRIINSQHRVINVEKFKQLCIDCNVTVLMEFDWAKLTNSVHRCLAHSWERIQDNGGFGLGNESEEVLEACNKLIRYYKKHGSRTFSVKDQFWDIFYHIWNASSPLLRALDPDPKYKQPERKDEILVHDLIESMFVDNIMETDTEDESSE